MNQKLLVKKLIFTVYLIDKLQFQQVSQCCCPQGTTLATIRRHMMKTRLKLEFQNLMAHPKKNVKLLLAYYCDEIKFTSNANSRVH